MRVLAPTLVALVVLGCGSSQEPEPEVRRTQPSEGHESSTEPSSETPTEPSTAPVAAPVPANTEWPTPEFEAFRDLDPDACVARVRALGIAFRDKSHEAVAAGMIVEEVGGVRWEFAGRLDVHRVMDCRLVLALHAWAPTLRAAGVRTVRHLSALRPSARVRSTGAPSGHSKGLAVDPRHFVMEDGSELDVLEDWVWRPRGAEPCPAEVDEPETSARLRAMVCQAVAAGIFQVVVTPHHDDAHANHVHVEVVPEVGWSWAR
ncbi:MAG: extensin family protein [Sandaracinus sp.]|nr:extensin family protein [Sandaracinus sp.]